MLSMGPVFRFRLKGREWNLLSLVNEEVGGALEGGEDWLKSGGVSVSDLAGSSPTAVEKPKIKVSVHSTEQNTFYCGLCLLVQRWGLNVLHWCRVTL